MAQTKQTNSDPPASSLTLKARLAAGPGRSLGCVDAVVAEALRDPDAVSQLVAALGDPRDRVVERAANALKKVQASQPARIQPHANTILKAAAACNVLFARWSLAVVVGRLELRGTQNALAVELLFDGLASESALLRTLSMSALWDLSAPDQALRRRVRPLVESALQSPSAAMRARARKLLGKTRQPTA